MQPKFTLKKFTSFLRYSLGALCIGIAGIASAQTVSTASGTNYLANLSINNPAPLTQSFVIENTTGSAVALNDVSGALAPFGAVALAGDPTAIRLFASSTSLSGDFDISTAAWSQIATGNAVVPAAVTITPLITGANYIIPAGAQRRFVLEITKGMRISGNFGINPTPTPNNFTSGGIILKVGDHTIGGQVVGFGGLTPTGSGNAGVFFTGSVTLVSTAPCAGTPAPGNTVSTANPVCPSANFTLSPQNATAGSGVTYQWQSSPDGTTWTDIGGATNASLTTNQTVATYYRVRVTCSGNTTATTGLQVTMAPVTSCYCTAAGGTFEHISRVQFGTIDNPSTNTTPYMDFTSISTNVIKGQTLPITVSISQPFSSDQTLVWIDLNQNGNFSDPGELVFTSAINGGPHTGNITIPATAATGPTRMRIRLHDSVFGPNATPCGTAPFGEVEDYTVNIQPCVTGAITAHPANTSTQCSGNASFTVTTSGSITNYAWEYRVNSASAWLPVTNTGVYTNSTTNTLTLSNVPASMSGYQFRALYSGPCNGIDFSNAATLTVTPLIATVSPNPSTICVGTVQQLTLTNASSPATATFNATGLPLAIPDGNTTGVSNTIVASGIPAAAIVTNVSLTFNLTHTWVGDIVMNLTAPNGQTINLVGALDGGTGSNSTDNFTGTVISSTGTVALSGAPAPRTGTFRADLLTATVPTIAPTTTNTWAPLLAGPLNGNWRIAIADIFGFDVGSLTSASLSITYGAPAAGIWTGPAGTMWTNLAATTPYTGTPANTIYVNPTATTTYQVVYTTPTPCTSAPTNVVVNVVAPITNVVQPVNRTVCVGGNTSITASATGGPFTWVWEVSTNGGATWSVVSGANTGTLNLTNVTQVMNNNLYRATISAPPCAGAPVVTSTARLTVNPLPVVTASATTLAITPGQTSTLSVTSSPAPGTPANYQWFYNGNAIAGATNATHTVGIDELGEYSARVTDVNGCTSTSNILTIGAQQSDRLWIYPNPTDGQFLVRVYYDGPFTDIRWIHIFNEKGQLVMKKAFDLYPTQPPYMQMSFDMTGFPAGTYVVKVEERYTGKIKSGLVIIQ
jgi:subtilisin-like proprotein convertase family protein